MSTSHSNSKMPHHVSMDQDYFYYKGDRGEFYDLAYDHLYSEHIDNNLWSACLSYYDMDKKKAEAAYIRQMATWMEDHYAERTAEIRANVNKRMEEERARKQEIEDEIDDLIRDNKLTLPKLTPLNGSLIFGGLGGILLLFSGYGLISFLLLLFFTTALGGSSFYLIRCILVSSFRKLESDSTSLAMSIIAFPICLAIVYFLFFESYRCSPSRTAQVRVQMTMGRRERRSSR